jgi:hypothetical protein
MLIRRASVRVMGMRGRLRRLIELRGRFKVRDNIEFQRVQIFELFVFKFKANCLGDY